MTWFFVDSVNGNDGETGHVASKPWKTITRVNAETYSANDIVWLKSGSVWRDAPLVVNRTNMYFRAWFDWTGNEGIQPIISGGTLITGWTLLSGTTYYATLAALPGVPPIVTWTLPPVTTPDPNTGLPVTAPSVQTGLVAGGSAGTLTTNQYFFDGGASRLYVNVGGDPADPLVAGEVEIAVRQCMTSAFNVTVCQNIDFRHGGNSAVELTTSLNSIFEGCWFRHTTRLDMGAGGKEGCIRCVDGGFAGLVNGFQVLGCQWQNCANTGIYVKNTRLPQLNLNTMLVAIGTVVGDQGSDGIHIDATGANNDCQLAKIKDNFVVMPTGSTRFPLNMEADPAVTSGTCDTPLINNNVFVGGLAAVRANVRNTCKIYNNTFRTQNGAGAAAILVDAAFDVAAMSIYQNLIYRGSTAIKFATETHKRQVTIVNNTFVNQTFAHLYLDAPVYGNIKNNLIWNYQAHVTDHIVYISSIAAAQTLAVDYNLLPASYTNCFRLGVTEYSDLASWQAGTGFSLNSISGLDPLLKGGVNVDSFAPAANPDVYFLTLGSPAIDTGVVFAGVSQVVYGSRPDIGAFEYFPVPLPTLPVQTGGGGSFVSPSAFPANASKRS